LFVRGCKPREQLALGPPQNDDGDARIVFLLVEVFAEGRELAFGQLATDAHPDEMAHELASSFALRFASSFALRFASSRLDGAFYQVSVTFFEPGTHDKLPFLFCER
jgi:hypothetical protein